MNSKRMGIFIAAAGVTLVALMGLPGAAEEAPTLSAALPAAPGAALGGEPGSNMSALLNSEVDIAAMALSLQGERLERQQQRAAELDWGRDPFAGPVASAPQPGAGLRKLPELPALTGISVVGTTRRAILGREIVQPGDELQSGWTVHAIVPGMVTLGFGSEVRVLQLTDGQG